MDSKIYFGVEREGPDMLKRDLEEDRKVRGEVERGPLSFIPLEKLVIERNCAK